MNTAHTISPGTTINSRYRIDRLIGKGGMGSVYEGTHLTINHRVAIKFLRTQYAGNTGMSERFLREARAAGSVRHDNICEVIDYGVLPDNSPYLVMPLLEGSALSEILKKSKIVPLPRIADIMVQTLSALQAVHDAKIVHRDLKPDNIFITSVGDRSDFVKILDFGISKPLAEAGRTLTKTGALLGTPYYMAPEQARGDAQLDQRVDIYAMGVVLYEMLTGRRPFEGQSDVEVLAQILTKQFPAPSLIEPSIPKSIERVVIRAMARQPADRYPTARQMRQAVEQAAVEWQKKANAEFTDSPTVQNEETSMVSPYQPTAAAEAFPVDDHQTVARAKSKTFLRKFLVPAVGLLIAVSLLAFFMRTADTEKIREGLSPQVKRLDIRKPEDVPVAPDAGSAKRLDITRPTGVPVAPDTAKGKSPAPLLCGTEEISLPDPDAGSTANLVPTEPRIQSSNKPQTGPKSAKKGEKRRKTRRRAVLKGDFNTEIDAQYDDSK